MKTRGHGKANVGFRILARKRQRSRRGLTQDDYYPLRLTVLQEQVSRGILHQTVCLRALSSFIATVEITHGLYTGFSTSLDNIAILPTKKHIETIRRREFACSKITKNHIRFISFEALGGISGKGELLAIS
ncbi:hypothetical protein COOONC_06770 [Cooperia oncophora]